MFTIKRKRIYFLDVDDFTGLDFYLIPVLGLDLDSLALGAVDAIDRIDIFEELKPPVLDGAGI
jgi:hypothetical protein